ncbi:putative F-box protein [Panicum miliaceum]|uniref:F-box protein n=1 Tax=Panicum miliaceum TaxID=4540 RepID=A0A3L6RZE6_PANMI|nr:putative F-box protein [Panicum miliaceum]
MASEVPEDILMQVFAALDVPDLVRAGSVCSAWHDAYTSLCDLGRWKQPQTPCLLYTAKSRGESAGCLYSLAEKKPYTLALPDPPIRSRHFLGSAYGWIIAADERSELHLLNPITGDQIALPSITTFEYVTPVYDENGAAKEYSSYDAIPGPDGPWTYGLRKLRDEFFLKVFLSSDPSTGDYIVAAIHNPYFRLSFARNGDDCWTPLPPHNFFGDCVFKDGLMYAATTKGAIHVFDFSGPAVKQKVVLGETRDYSFQRVNIVQTPCGDLLQVWSHIDRKPDDESELDPLEEDDDFSDPELPFENQTVCLNAQGHPQLKANHIYFTDNDEYVTVRKKMIRDIGVLSLCDDSKEKIASPQIWSNWPSPIWITPNPRRMKSARCRSIEGTVGILSPGFSTARSSGVLGSVTVLWAHQVHLGSAPELAAQSVAILWAASHRLLRSWLD